MLNAKLEAKQGAGLYSRDIFEEQTTGRLLYYNASSANTPYKAGLTKGTEGVAISVGNWESFFTCFAMGKGATSVFMYSKNPDTITDWKKII